MISRKFQYDIEFSHVLTFQDYYKKAIAPFFIIDNLRYAIENYGTTEESLKLVFNDHNMVIHCSKGAIKLLYEGDANKFFNSGNPQFDIFNDIFEAIRKMDGFGRLTNHVLKVHFVQLNETIKPFELNDIDKSLYLKRVPLQNTTDFSIIFEAELENEFQRIHIGNFRSKDIEKFDLSPFRTKHNSDLFEAKEGYYVEGYARRPIEKFSKTKFKELLEEVINFVEKTL